MIDKVFTVRAGQARAAATPTPGVAVTGGHHGLGAISRELPMEMGHWGTEYFREVLDTLKQAPPGCVLEIDAGDFGVDAI